MHTIQVNFERFREVHLGNLFGACGVYVLWDSQAQARPTYIGEGNILKRLSDHWIRHDLTLAQPLDGYVAIIGDHGHRPSKKDGLAVEYLLLEVARAADRTPRVNKHPGNQQVVERLCDLHRTVRLAVSGFDPLGPPQEARPLTRAKQIKAWLNPAEELEIEHDWRLRRVRRPRAR